MNEYNDNSIIPENSLNKWICPECGCEVGDNDPINSCPQPSSNYCPDCGKRIEVFGKSRLDEVAEAFNLPILARLPIDPKVAENYDSGLMETVNTDGVADVITAVENA